LGVLGDSSDPLLNVAISQIKGSGRKAPQNPKMIFENVIDSYPLNSMKNEMYVDLP
jgi:carboxyl-terminal processing protease